MYATNDPATGRFTGPLRSPEQRFWEKVEKTSTCWNWTASLTAHGGYGQFQLGGTMVPAHRFAYERASGPVPAGLELDHLCRNRRCVNPAHLEPVTRLINVRRGIAPLVNGEQNRRKTHCKRGHAFDDTPRRGGRRHCRTCRRESQRERRARANG